MDNLLFWETPHHQFKVCERKRVWVRDSVCKKQEKTIWIKGVAALMTWSIVSLCPPLYAFLFCLVLWIWEGNVEDNQRWVKGLFLLLHTHTHTDWQIHSHTNARHTHVHRPRRAHVHPQNRTLAKLECENMQMVLIKVCCLSMTFYTS